MNNFKPLSYLWKFLLWVLVLFIVGYILHTVKGALTA